MQLKFELSMDMTNVILNALGDAPYRVAAPVIAILQAQAQPQMQPQLVPEDKANNQTDEKEKA